MRFEVLGPVRLLRGAEATAVSGSLRRNLLAVLLSRANESVPVETLLDALWGEQRDSGLERRLHVHVYKVRAMLGDPERLSFSPGGYCLTVLPGELDVDEFDTLVDESTSVAVQDPHRCVELLRKALSLFRGAPYQGVDVLELAGEIQRCSERRLVAVEELYAAELRCGRHAAIVGELSDLVGQHPLRERLHGLLMMALYRGGRQGDALAAYQHARDVLVAELGLEPGPELQEIERQVLAGESMPIDGTEQQPSQLRVPAQLPVAPAGFVGREAELTELDAVLSRGSESVAVSAVVGSGGVGKTALTLWWAHRVRDQFPDGQLYVDLGGYGPDEPVRPEDALAGFLRALGFEGAAIPRELAERSAKLRSLLDGTRTLLVLDNARTVDQVRPLLPSTSGCLVLVTSRDPLAGLVTREGANRISLGDFAPREALQLLRDLLGADRVEADPSGVDRLVERCARLPLALRIAAERIRFRARASISDLVDELDDPRERLDLLETGGDPTSSVRTVLSWSYHQLPSPAAELFRLWGLHTGYDIDTDALAALTGHDARSTRRALEVLQRAHLVDEPIPGRYVLHDLVHAYATELTHEIDDETARNTACARLFDHYLDLAVRAMEWITPQESELRSERAAEVAFTQGFSSYEAARWWLDTERANLVHVAEQAPGRGLPIRTTDLSTVLGRYFDHGWYQDDAHRVHTRAVEVAQQRGDRVAEGIALRNLGLRLYRLNQYDQATTYLVQALSLQRELGEASSEAMTLNYLAGAYQIVGRIDEAISQLNRALDLYRELGYRSLVMRPLDNLGYLHRRRGQYAWAHKCFRRALAIAEEIDHRPHKARSLSNLARLFMETGDNDDALDYAHRARSIAHENGLPVIECTVLDTVGVVNRRLGNIEQAIESCQEALIFARNCGDNKLTSRVLNSLAEARAANGEPHHACRLHWEALATSSGVAARPEHARAYAGLGDAHAFLGLHSTATEHWQHALEIYRELDAPEANEIAAKLAESRRRPVS